MKTLGEKLVAARNAQNLTQEQLASKINVARTTISNWENDRSYPDFDSLCILSDVLHYDFLAESSHSSGEQEPNCLKALSLHHALSSMRMQKDVKKNKIRQRAVPLYDHGRYEYGEGIRALLWYRRPQEGTPYDQFYRVCCQFSDWLARWEL